MFGRFFGWAQKTRSSANGRGFPFPPSATPYQSLGQTSAMMTGQSLTIGAPKKSAVLKLILPCLLFPSTSLNAPHSVCPAWENGEKLWRENETAWFRSVKPLAAWMVL